MRVVIIGANGQLGQDVTAAFQAEGDDVVALTHQDVRVDSPESVTQALEAARPQVVVNAAAFNHVENSETQADLAFAVNALGARNVARSTHALKARLLHISTDYVFNGAKNTPYLESDLPSPLNVYGNTKLAGEYFVRAANPQHFILRVSAIYGRHPCRGKGGLNFVELMLKLAAERDLVRVVDDEFVSPTSTVEIARQIVRLSQTEDYGLSVRAGDFPAQRNEHFAAARSPWRVQHQG
jgi:dTDP-4-dehydrorhamnose reductase